MTDLNVGRSPLARAMLVRLAPHRHVIALTYHRLILDAYRPGERMYRTGVPT
jgi:hypothetical protein